MDFKQLADDWDKRANDGMIEAICSGCTDDDLFWGSGIQESIDVINLLNEHMSAGAFKKNDVIVDLGCGSGRVVGPMAALVPNVKFFGVDVSNVMLKQARSRFKAIKNLRFKAVRKTDGKIPLGDKSVNAVFEVLTLQHLPRQMLPAVVAEVVRVLKPGGLFACWPPTGSEEISDVSCDRSPEDTWTSRAYGMDIWRDLMAPFEMTLENVGIKYGEAGRLLALWRKT